MSEEQQNAAGKQPAGPARAAAAGVGVLGLLVFVVVRGLIWLGSDNGWGPFAKPAGVPNPSEQRLGDAFSRPPPRIVVHPGVAGTWTSYHWGIADTVATFGGSARAVAAADGKFYLTTPRDTLDLLRLSQSGKFRLQVNEYHMTATLLGDGAVATQQAVLRFGFLDLQTAVLEVDAAAGGDELVPGRDLYVDSGPAAPLKWYAADRTGAAQAIREVWGKQVAP